MQWAHVVYMFMDVWWNVITDIKVDCVFLWQLQRVSTSEELRELLDSDEYDFRYTCGIAQPTSTLELKDRDRIVASFAIHFPLMCCMTELIQLKEGLGALKVLQLLQGNPHVTCSLLVFSPPKSLTADKLYMFTASLSPAGSNRRETEEFVYMQWVNLMQEIEGKA